MCSSSKFHSSQASLSKLAKLISQTPDSKCSIRAKPFSSNEPLATEPSGNVISYGKLATGLPLDSYTISISIQLFFSLASSSDCGALCGFLSESSDPGFCLSASVGAFGSMGETAVRDFPLLGDGI